MRLKVGTTTATDVTNGSRSVAADAKIRHRTANTLSHRRSGPSVVLPSVKFLQRIRKTCCLGGAHGFPTRTDGSTPDLLPAVDAVDDRGCGIRCIGTKADVSREAYCGIYREAAATEHRCIPPHRPRIQSSLRILT